MRTIPKRHRRGEVNLVRRGPRRSRVSQAVRGALLGTGGLALWAGLVIPAGAQDLELSALDPLDGFRINGEAAEDFSGRSVSAAGDINGDGIDDLLIGAHTADPNGNSFAGASYVVFGRDTAASGAFPASGPTSPEPLARQAPRRSYRNESSNG